MTEKKGLAELLSDIEEKVDDVSREIRLFLDQFGLEITSEEHSSLTSAIRLLDLVKYYINKARVSIMNI
jgi:hypothetical protein